MSWHRADSKQRTNLQHSDWKSEVLHCVGRRRRESVWTRAFAGEAKRLLRGARRVERLEHSVQGVRCCSDTTSANGLAESAVKEVKDAVRTNLACLVRRFGQKFPGGHPVLTWLVKYSVAMVNRCRRGPDGKTAYAADARSASSQEHCRILRRWCSSALQRAQSRHASYVRVSLVSRLFMVHVALHGSPTEPTST